MATNEPFDFFIQWHLTEKCNLSCRHCYQDLPGTDEMSLSEIKKVLTEASDMIKEWSEVYGIEFSPSMNITGGEPLLRSDLFDILTEVKKSGFKIFLLTNGTLVDRATSGTLSDIGVDGVQVSMEGSEPVHNSVRGPGSFSRAATGIQLLVERGLNVTLNMTLSGMNAGEVEKILDFGFNAQVSQIGFSRLVPAGKGQALLSLLLSQTSLREIYTSLFSLKMTGPEIVTGDPVAAQIHQTVDRDAGDIAVRGCSAGVSGITIRPNGTLNPCRRLPLSLGNVRKDSLREIWSASPVLQALRTRNGYKGKCGNCRRWAICRGCRGIAYAWSRSRGEENYLADDPQCFIEGKR